VGFGGVKVGASLVVGLWWMLLGFRIGCLFFGWWVLGGCCFFVAYDVGSGLGFG